MTQDPKYRVSSAVPSSSSTQNLVSTANISSNTTSIPSTVKKSSCLTDNMPRLDEKDNQVCSSAFEILCFK